MPRITEYYDVTVKYNASREHYNWWVLRGSNVVDYGFTGSKKRAYKKAFRAVRRDRATKQLEFSETIRIPVCDR